MQTEAEFFKALDQLVKLLHMLVLKQIVLNKKDILFK